MSPFNPVSRPEHYTSDPSGFEQIHFSRYMNFNLGNAFKYMWRAGLKGPILVDYQKACYYMCTELSNSPNTTRTLTEVALVELLGIPLVAVHRDVLTAAVMRLIIHTHVFNTNSTLHAAIEMLDEEITLLKLNSTNEKEG